MEKEMTFKDLYRFPGFRAKARLTPHPEHAGAWVVALHRRQKKRFARAAMRKGTGMISEPVLRQCPIWVGGKGRTEEDMNLFYDFIGDERSRTIELAVMDMWKPFRNAVAERAPQAKVIFDKFHILNHLSKAVDEVRRNEYKRVNDKERKYIKGQRYTLLSHRANLDTEGRRSLKALLKVNNRLYTAYLLKESFAQLWDYNYPASARKFFERWKSQLRWQRLKSFEKFAAMIDKHWDGIVSYCHPDNKVSLGFMEGLNNKIRVIQRRAYGIRNDEYLSLKIITSFIKDD